MSLSPPVIRVRGIQSPPKVRWDYRKSKKSATKRMFCAFHGDAHVQKAPPHDTEREERPLLAAGLSVLFHHADNHFPRGTGDGMDEKTRGFGDKNGAVARIRVQSVQSIDEFRAVEPDILL